MAIDNSKIDLMAGNDEVVMNQRVRAYVPAAQGVGTNNGQFGTLWMQGTGIPSSIAGSGNQTITAAQLGSGIIVQSPSSAATWTLDTAANIIAYMQANSAGLQVGDILVCDVINAGTSTGTITINPGTNGSLDGNQASLTMPINTSRTLFFVITALTGTATYKVFG
jgi:hypothetical protein